MKKSETLDERKSWIARLKVAVASIALAGVLAGGAAVVSSDAPAQTDDDTTEVALDAVSFKSYGGYQSFARSSWH